jgi:hypothetical protein
MVAVSTRSGSSRFSPLLLLFHPFYAIALGVRLELLTNFFVHVIIQLIKELPLVIGRLVLNRF